MIEGWYLDLKGHIRHRSVSQLSPNAGLAFSFEQGLKKLIPMVHVHDRNSCAADSLTIPMQLASFGYLCILPDMIDGSAPWTTDEEGNNLFFEKIP